MKIKFGALFIAIFIGLAAAPIRAQDSKIDETKCSIETVDAVLKVYLDSIQKIIDSHSQDPLAVSNFLQAAANTANELRATCDGLIFSGKKQTVVGPVRIPEGIYRAIATTKKYMAVHVDATEGECGVGTRMSTISLFNLSEGEGNDGAEAVFVSKDCRALITIDNVNAEWKLEFQRISTD